MASFLDVNVAYSDLVEIILKVADKIASFKDLRVTNITQDSFDKEVSKSIKIREKRLRHFK